MTAPKIRPPFEIAGIAPRPTAISTKKKKNVHHYQKKKKRCRSPSTDTRIGDSYEYSGVLVLVPSDSCTILCLIIVGCWLRVTVGYRSSSVPVSTPSINPPPNFRMYSSVCLPTAIAPNDDEFRRESSEKYLHWRYHRKLSALARLGVLSASDLRCPFVFTNTHAYNSSMM